VLFARMGRSGLSVSKLCLGTMYFGVTTPEPEASEIMAAALDAGITFWDTSNAYNSGRSEEVIGNALTALTARSRVVLATKVFYSMGEGPNDRGAGRRHLLMELEAQLRRLQTEWIDLYYLHRPDFGTPLDETIETLDACVRAGKIRYWATSTFPSWLMAEASWRCERRGWTPPICEQAPYNLLDRRLESERLAFLREYGWGLVCWSPLAGGLLSGKYAVNAIDAPPQGTRLSEMQARYRGRVGTRGLAKAHELAELARAAGLEPIHLAIAWLLRQNVVTSAVIGPRSVEQMRAYVDAIGINLDGALLADVDRIVPPGSAFADFHDTSEWLVGPLTTIGQ
jgi:aryl-alcohol dehydrogenase-like predicted oxidoreductase